jgi:hypothetical protein
MTRDEQLKEISQTISKLQAFRLSFGLVETNQGCSIYQHVGDRTFVRACDLSISDALQWLDGYVWSCYDHNVI